MSEPNLDESTLVTLLDLALAEYAYRADGGEPVDREAFVAEYAEKLRACLAASDQVEQHAARGEPHVDPLRDGRTLPPDDVSRVAAPETVAYRDASTPALPLGAKVRYFGDYELLEEIARGGMGVVYKARQTRLNRIVALKMILAGQLASADDVKRFHTEAEAAANLQHPNIVAIHEVGEHEGQHYFSMDYVEGRSLADLARANPPSARQAAEYVGSIAQAIQYAHEQGTLHRDLKPANVLIDRHGQPRVTDFGLARRIEGGSELTGTGQILGTPSYMPPEQAAGNRGEVGPASDVYSLGAILYELVAGRPPFRAETPLDTLLQVLEQEPAAPRLLNPKLRRDLETICLKCLRKEPGKRYGSAGELAADLGRFLAGEPILARRVGVGERAVKWAKRRPAVAAMIGVTVVAIFGSGIAVKLTRTAAAKRQTETEQAAAKRQAETELSASRARAQTAVEAMLTAPAAAVPYTLANLQSLREFSLPLLRQRLNDPQADRVQRLHAAYALADLGETPQGPLLDAIVTAPAGECINLVVALAHVKEAALPELTRRAESAEENTDKARCAIVALHLGDPQPAINALAVRGDPVHRTTLIHAYANWHGKLSAELFDNDDAAYRSGLCAAVGRIAPEALEPGEREAATQALTELYLHDPEGGTHAAADWALRQWRIPLPTLARGELRRPVEQERRIAQLMIPIDDLRRQISEAEKQGQPAWESQVCDQTPPLPASLNEGLAAHFPLDETAGTEAANAVKDQPTGSYIGQGQPRWAPGVVAGAVHLDGAGHFDCGNAFAPERAFGFSYGCWFFSENAHPRGALIDAALISKYDGKYQGFELAFTNGRVGVFGTSAMASRRLSGARWHHVFVCQKMIPPELFVDGDRVPGENFGGTPTMIKTAAPLTLGSRGASYPLIGAIDDVRCYNRVLEADEVRQLYQSGIAALARVPAERRTPAQNELLTRCFREQDESLAELRRRLERAESDLRTARWAGVRRHWFVNSQGMTMVEVPAGKFMMGTPGEVNARDRPAHEVTLTRAFFIADREVTREQFMKFLDSRRGDGEDYSYLIRPDLVQLKCPTPDCAMPGPSWFDALSYCNWLSAQEGRRACYEPTGEKEKLPYTNRNGDAECDVWRCDFSADGYRLPTEAEWEYAARGGTSGAFYYGDDEDLLPQYAWFAANGKSRAWPGGAKLPNALGLFDVHGNVQEWCWDWFAEYGAKAVSDPSGPAAAGHNVDRISRGGTYYQSDIRCAYRGHDAPLSRGSDNGIRVCCGL